MSKTPISISATIITFNEERKVENCIRSLLGVADEIIIVDSCSTDSTREICQRYPVKFLTHPFQGYVAQKNFAVQQATHEYILALDADERLSEELKKSILAIKENWGDVSGYIVHRYNNYCGKWMNYSGWYEKKIRLWRRDKAKWVGTDPHDYVRISEGKTGVLKGDLIHYAYLTIDEHIKQTFRFAEVAARAKYRNGERANLFINVFFSPLVRFIKSYFLQLGFLDGYYGFMFCAISSSMTFFKYVRLVEYKRKGLPEDQPPIQEISG